MDISNPANPQEVGYYEVHGYPIKLLWDIVIQDKLRMFRLSMGGLWILDISNPANPTGLGHCCPVGHDVDVAGDYAYVADCSMGVDIIDVRRSSKS